MFQISQVGGVLESSGPPLEDGHRDFEDWCILGWGIHENKWANSNDAKCKCNDFQNCYNDLLQFYRMS